MSDVKLDYEQRIRYELRTLTGETEIKVRLHNTHIPENQSIYGIFDTKKGEYVVGDRLSPSHYFWTCVKSSAQYFADKLNNEEKLGLDE